jgi:vitamin K-dependent gamma-carboxylase
MLNAFRKSGTASATRPLDPVALAVGDGRCPLPAGPNGWVNGPLLPRLFTPVDVATLVWFRVAFGAIMLYQVWRYWASGWIERFVAPVVPFTFYGFEWVRAWPGNGMYWHFLALGILAACIMLGLWYRLAAALFFFGYSYVFLLDPVRYQNHVYLVCLLSLLLVFVPAHRAFSADARLRPALRSDWAPAWSLWLLRAQIAMPYVFGGLAKINEDWLRGEPLRMWLANRSDWPLVGPLFSQEPTVYLMAYGGLLLDLFIVPLLLWRRTRVFAFAVAAAFHLSNVYLFNIGIFPWLMIAATALYFDPSWPRRAIDRVRRMLGRRAPPEAGGAHALLAPPMGDRLRPAQRVTVALLGAYLAVQLLLPLRHFLYPSNVDWTEEGYLYAWRMKLTAKDASAQFFATDPSTNTTWEIDPRPYFSRPALRASSYEEIARRPDLTLQFAHHLASDLRRRGYANVEVRALVTASMNRRRRQLLIDPRADLAAQPRTLGPSAWIVPLLPLDQAARRPLLDLR